MISVVVAIIVILIDFITKRLAVNYIEPVGSVPVINDILDFTYVENRGMAFGALKDARWIFITVSVIMISVIAVLIWKFHSKSKVFDVLLGLIMGGGIGNMIDRVWLGYVVDFIDFCAFDFWKWVFNVADAAICVGTAILVVYLLFFDNLFADKQEVKNE